MTNLYDLPFEKRIRIKYMLFGIIVGMTLLSTLMLVGDIGGYIVRIVLIQTVIESTIESYIFNQIIMYSVFLLFMPLIYWMWHSKAKPHKHQFLDETIGLKSDWDKVNK